MICLGFGLLVASQPGCATPELLARELVQDGPWGNFEEAKTAFEHIVPGATTLEELTALRFDPGSSRASSLINYTDVRGYFVPNDGITIADASEGVQHCIEIRDHCTAWRIALIRERERRIGNVFLDWLLFRRTTRTTGWRFDALILIEEERVFYKIWSGVPSVLRHRDRLRPLGFLQELVSIFPAVVGTDVNLGDTR